MKLLKKLLGTDKVLDSVGNIIDDLVTTKEEKIQAKTKLKEIMNSYKIEIEKNITARWEADANGNVNTGTLEDLRVDFEGTVPPKRTEVVTVGGNLNSSTSTYRVLQSQSSLKVSGSSAQASALLNDLDQTSAPFDPRLSQPMICPDAEPYPKYVPSE